MKRSNSFGGDSMFIDEVTGIRAESIGVWYHGTLDKFTEFSPSPRDIGYHFGTEDQARNRVFDLKPKEPKYYLMGVELECKSPIIVYEDIFTSVPYTTFQKLYSGDVTSSLGKPIFDKLDYDEVMTRWGKDFEVTGYWDTLDNYNFFRHIEGIFRRKGIDSIYYYNENEAGPESFPFSWCVLDKRQIKIVSFNERHLEGTDHNY